MTPDPERSPNPSLHPEEAAEEPSRRMQIRVTRAGSHGPRRACGAYHHEDLRVRATARFRAAGAPTECRGGCRSSDAKCMRSWTGFTPASCRTKSNDGLPKSLNAVSVMRSRRKSCNGRIGRNGIFVQDFLSASRFPFSRTGNLGILGILESGPHCASCGRRMRRPMKCECRAHV
jgi:hypothetical protein